MPRTYQSILQKKSFVLRIGIKGESAAGNGLFDLSTDIAEKRDLSKEKPEILDMVQSRFRNWVGEMDAAEPRGPFRDF